MKSYRSASGVLKISFGHMIPTETVMDNSFVATQNEKLHDTTENAIIDLIDVTTHFQLDINTNWRFNLKPEDSVFGLGQSLRGMNKRGFVYEAFCTDDPNHTPDKLALYGAHNFFIVQGEKTWGLYIDFAGKVKYDVAFSDVAILDIEVEGGNFDAYYFEGTFKEIVKSFRSMIGLSYTPPKWAFGYQQSRWSYEDETVVRMIADQFDASDIPCDAIYLDIDYMERFKDFTISDERFPNFQDLVSDLKQKDIKLIPIIDAGVKIEPGYDAYEEGIENDYFCTDSDGKAFVAAVWPGKVHFPDVLNTQARKWFGNKYHALLDMGIEGFWNDMNEPAIFYSEQGLKEAIAFIKNQEDKNLDIYTFFQLKDKIFGLSNAEKDYKSMYHQMDGTRVNHYDVHNLYGYNMTRAADEGFERYDANKRFFLLTRASHIGMAKHSGIWTGDNHSWWEHLKLNIQMMPGLGMAGFLYTGADTGGFGCNASAQLVTRWLQFSVFTPLLRNHSALGTRRQEPWQFDADSFGINRDILRMRYALVPYIYSEFMKANLNRDLLFAPLSYDYEDTRSKEVEDQLLFGDSVMLAPVYEQNAKGRAVYLPESMVLWRIRNFEALEKQPFEQMQAGFHYVPLAMEEFPIFLRPNKLMVVTKPENRVSKLDTAHLIVIGYVENTAEYVYYDDDGETQAFKEGQFKTTRFTVKKSDTTFNISVETDDAALETVTFYLIDDHGICHVLKQVTSNVTNSYA